MRWRVPASGRPSLNEPVPSSLWPTKSMRSCACPLPSSRRCAAEGLEMHRLNTY